MLFFFDIGHEGGYPDLAFSLDRGANAVFVGKLVLHQLKGDVSALPFSVSGLFCFNPRIN